MEAIWNIICQQLGISVILTFFLVLFTVYYTYSTWNYDYWKKQGVPGDNAWPIVGTMKPQQYLFHRLELLDQEKHNKYGRVYGGFEGRTPVLYITDPELIKQVMVKDFSTFTNRRDFIGQKEDPIFSKMVSVMKGEVWKATRAVLTPTFTTGKLKQMMHLIEECTKTLIKSLDEAAEAKKPIDLKRYFSAFSLDVVASCAFGMKTNSLENPDNEFVRNARKTFQAPTIITFLIALFPKSFLLIRKPLEYFVGNPFAYFRDVASKMIDMRLEQKLQPRKDFLDLLIEAQQQEGNNETTENVDANSMTKAKKILTRQTMVSNCIVFLVAGSETTGTTLSFLAYCLATNPQVQEKLIQEIDDVMTECKGNLSYETVMGLQYLDMVLSETMRMYPPGTRVERACGVDGHKLQDIVMKKDSLVIVSVYALHYDEEFYPNPEVYDPERFSPENKANRHPFTYMPFGVGPRNCIAMRFALTELKLTVAYLLSQFRFTTNDKTEDLSDCPIGETLMFLIHDPLMTFGQSLSYLAETLFPLKYSSAFGMLLPKTVTLLLQKRVDRPHFNN